jgi:hypothetical protein
LFHFRVKQSRYAESIGANDLRSYGAQGGSRCFSSIGFIDANDPIFTFQFDDGA